MGILVRARLIVINPLSANPKRWSNILKQFAGKLLTTSLSMFDHFVGLALKELIRINPVLTNIPILWFLETREYKMPVLARNG